MGKLTSLRRQVSNKINAIDSLMTLLATSQDDVKKILAQAQIELEKEKAKYETVKVDHEEIKIQCVRVSKFVDRILEVLLTED